MTEANLPSDYDWREATIPGGSSPVTLARLSLDRQSGATQSLVRFPAGWTRPVSGWYSADEEILIIEGSLQMSGVAHRTGDYAYVPASYLRSSTSTEDGCLVLAWFSGKPIWQEDSAHGPGYDPARLVEVTWSELPIQSGPCGYGRCVREEGTASSWILTGEEPIRASSPVDLFSLTDRTWTQVQAATEITNMTRPLFARVGGRGDGIDPGTVLP
jgi:hypothetical protein